MPCDTKLREGQTLEQRGEQIKRALKRLEQKLSSGQVRVAIAQNGAVAFAGWADRDDVSDVCAYRVLSSEGSSALRMAVARAQAISGRQVSPQAVASGWHTHNGVAWSKH